MTPTDLTTPTDPGNPTPVASGDPEQSSLETVAAQPPPVRSGSQESPADQAAKNDHSEWGGETPPVLKQPEGRARLSAAVGGTVLAVCGAVLCFFTVPHGSILGRMFDLREVQVAVPISILTVFFWGLFLCYHRWQRVRASEHVSSFEVLRRFLWVQ